MQWHNGALRTIVAYDAHSDELSILMVVHLRCHVDTVAVHYGRRLMNELTVVTCSSVFVDSRLSYWRVDRR